MKLGLIAATIATGITTCACQAGSVEKASPTAETASPTLMARATLTAEDLQPPKQDNDPRYEDVVFDPCTYVDDATVIEAGFDPASRKRNDRTAEWTNLACSFDSAKQELLLISGNVRFEDQQQRFSDKQVSKEVVNGREAFVYREPGDPRTCFIDMRTKVGSALVAVTTDIQFANQIEPCDGIVDLAKIIEPTIGAEN